MMKSGNPVLIVDSVEKAIKFYTEKLAFDITNLESKMEGSERILTYAHLRKGKCFIMFRTPRIEELAEFSFIKRCASRCVGVYAEMKKGIDKYYQRCNKKGVQIVSELKDQGYGHRTFSIKDPFGVRLTFAQPIEDFIKKHNDFAGFQVNTEISDEQKQEDMIRWLKNFGILRRAAKKYSKFWIKTSNK